MPPISARSQPLVPGPTSNLHWQRKLAAMDEGSMVRLRTMVGLVVAALPISTAVLAETQVSEPETAANLDPTMQRTASTPASPVMPIARPPSTTLNS